ncbi:hypothetical protein P872_18390 [Rhodonellum psychrophilum GCM71 = DSM 17998]|uniref:Uncharacterized protein n=2 Tax=Rhodonellum TaxID=336827 RepID=U5C2I6_9BACT|nr:MULTISPECIES: hypothetical protein [Rhodonellum]ERM82367.1 hypothetical protein P872_18390 [Rhodonellum psychrophilum GCM71 = DSM 17998]SDZ35236.1 hypothetical protein SAMN05444412_11132 [Rhodonellum ikkaensis]
MEQVKEKVNETINEKQGELMTKKLIRSTGALRTDNGNYIINSEDLFEWFKSGAYLNEATEWDSI